MPIRPIQLDDASPEQRREYVRSFLNLDAGLEDSDQTILAKIQAAQPGNTMIFINEPDTMEEQVATETAPDVPLRQEEQAGRMAGSLGKGDPRAVIVIPSVEGLGEAGARDIVVGVNGRAWQLKRDVELSVPWRVVEALDNAVANIVTHRQDEGHEGEVVERKARRAAYYFMHKPSDEEIAEWHRRTDAEFCA